MMMKKISVADAVGTVLGHDITEVRPGEFKGPAFKRGHRVCDGDICHLQKLGKNHIYLLDLAHDEIHEDEAALALAGALAGEGIVIDSVPKEGKIQLYAARDGLLVVNRSALSRFNMVDEVMCATLHRYTRVKKGDRVAATRAIPLVLKRGAVEAAVAIAKEAGGVVAVRYILKSRVGLVITGTEVFNGLIEDRFAPILTKKVEALGSIVSGTVFVPDDAEAIRKAVAGHLENGCDIILLSGGMSVDPDDVTRTGVRRAGAREIHYGSAMLPGAMFMTAYIDGIPLLGVPACAMYHRITVLDLVLPRILAGEYIGKQALADLGHGGLCLDCPTCVYPHCWFGKGA